MAKKRATLTDLLNDLTYKTIYERFKMIAINEHEWGNLPEGMEERHIETLLFGKGKACFLKDPKMKFLCLEVDEGGHKNVYGDSLDWRVQGFNYSRHLWQHTIEGRPRDEFVIIRNNPLALPTDLFITHYVNKLAEAERTMDVNVKACKTPIIFACDDKDILSFKRMFQQVDGNVPALFVDRGLNLDSITAFQTGVKFMGNDLMDYKRAVESDLLTFLGQNNTPVDKKERLITDEATANNQLIQSFADLQLIARQKACKEINEMFGLSITVKRRDGVENFVEKVEKSNDDV